MSTHLNRPESGLRRRSWLHSLGPPLGFGCTGGRRLSVLHPWLSGGLGSLQHEAQPMEVVQATAPTQPQVKALLEKLPYYFPVPVGQFNPRLPRRILHRRLQLVLLKFKTGGNPQSAQRPNLGPRLGESCPASFRWYEALSPKPQPLEWPTTLGPTTIAHRSRSRGVGARYILSRAYIQATVPGVALCLSSLPPPPIDFFYRISQLPCRFALCSFHLSPNPPMDTEDSVRTEAGAIIRARTWVDRLAGGLQALLGAPMAAYSGCGERMAG